jgi:hypothetical protein
MIQCGHLFTRRNYSTRWDEDNAKAQCSGCNMRHEHDPWPFTQTFIDEIGADGVDELHAKHVKVCKLKTFEILEIAKEYEDKLKALKQERQNGGS